VDPTIRDLGAGVKGARRQKGFCRDSYSVSQVRQILGRIDTSTLLGKRDFALIGLLARCGLRTIEVSRAKVGDIRQVGDKTVLFVQSKGSNSKDEFVVLVANTINAIMDYLIARGSSKPNDPLFASVGDGNRGCGISTRTIRHITKCRARACGIDSPRLSAHSYRHFMVTTAVSAGVPLDEVREAARHASIQSTQLYMHNVNRSQGVAETKVDEVLGDPVDAE
jgi:site-specific recombinase XerD